MSELARRLEAAMKAKKHSQIRAAEELEVSQTQLSNYKRDAATIPEYRWPLFAEYLGVDVDEFRRLAVSAEAERLVPKLDLVTRVAVIEAKHVALEADVDQIGTTVDEIRGELREQIGMLEAVLRMLGEERRNGTPPRRAPVRRGK